MKVVIFIGYSGSGKTSAIVEVVGQLVKAGQRVGTLKHIHERGFSIDTVGKDTWRHASAGASVVMALAPKELTLIEKMGTADISIDSVFRDFRSRHVDYLIVEGLYRRLSRRRGVVRVLCAKTFSEAEELLDVHPRPVCILTQKASEKGTLHGVPVLRLPADLRRLMRLIVGGDGGR